MLEIILFVSLLLNVFLFLVLCMTCTNNDLALLWFIKPKNLCGRCHSNQLSQLQKIGAWVNYLCPECNAYKWRNEKVFPYKAAMCVDDRANQQAVDSLLKGTGIKV